MRKKRMVYGANDPAIRPLRFILLWILLPVSLKAQQHDSFHRFGMGIEATTFSSVDLARNDLPSSMILLNADPLKWLRVELRFGHRETIVENAPFVETGHAATRVSCGLHYLLVRKACNFSFGCRYVSVQRYADYLSYDNHSATPIIRRNTFIGRAVSPILGAEFFFSSGFSVGAEISWLHLREKSYPAEPSLYDALESVNAATESCIMLRFYPF